jgi:hypothetical protein
MCDVESWSFAYHTTWNISKTKQESVKEVTLQFSMIFQIRLKNNTVNFRVICMPFKTWAAVFYQIYLGLIKHALWML